MILGEGKIKTLIAKAYECFAAKEFPRKDTGEDRSVGGYFLLLLKSLPEKSTYSKNAGKEIDSENGIISKKINLIPYDCFWGNGLLIYDLNCVQKDEWKGGNNLGKILGETREILREK